MTNAKLSHNSKLEHTNFTQDACVSRRTIAGETTSHCSAPSTIHASHANTKVFYGNTRNKKMQPFEEVERHFWIHSQFEILDNDLWTWLKKKRFFTRNLFQCWTPFWIRFITQKMNWRLCWTMERFSYKHSCLFLHSGVKEAFPERLNATLLSYEGYYSTNQEVFHLWYN